MKIIAVYKIINTITGDFYIGSSKDVKRRWNEHKYLSRWNKCPNNQMYLDMQKYGVDKFDFQVIAEVEADSLKESEQRFIEKLQSTYNNNNAKGLDIERHKEYEKEYNKTNKIKEYRKEYHNQPCSYNGETLTLSALSMRFIKAGIEHPILEAKRYLI